MAKDNIKKYHLIADDLKKKIADQVYDKDLPSIRDLAKEYDVHLITARKALLQLKAEGLIDSKGNRKYTIVKSPAKEQNRVIGVLSPASGHIWSDFLGCLIDKLKHLNYLPVIINPYEKDEDKPIEHLKLLIKLNPVAVFINGHYLENYPPLDILFEEVPQAIVFSDLSKADQPNNFHADRVLMDHFQGGYLGTQHLLGLGHRRILLLTHALTHTEQPERSGNYDLIRGYLTALHEAGLKGEELILYEDVEDIPDHARLREILKDQNRPTAIMAGEDYRAVVAGRIIKEMNCKIPDDFSLVGYYNTPWASLSEWKLTTISIRETEIARIVGELITSRKNTPQTVKIEPELIIRSSSGKAPGI